MQPALPRHFRHQRAAATPRRRRCLGWWFFLPFFSINGQSPVNRHENAPILHRRHTRTRIHVQQRARTYGRTYARTLQLSSSLGRSQLKRTPPILATVPLINDTVLIEFTRTALDEDQKLPPHVNRDVVHLLYTWPGVGPQVFGARLIGY